MYCPLYRAVLRPSATWRQWGCKEKVCITARLNDISACRDADVYEDHLEMLGVGLLGTQRMDFRTWP